MISATAILWAEIGGPAVEGVAAGRPGDLCYVCGAESARWLTVEDWMGDHFVDQNRVRAPASLVVCEACAFFSSRYSPVPGREAKPGKKRGGNYRNYSHLYDEGDEPRYRNASKGEKPVILAWLRAPRRGLWFAAIGETGQKHVLPWTPINGPGGRLVRFEETDVRLPSHPNGWGLVDAAAALLSGPGCGKAMIETGRYGQEAWRQQAEAIEEFEAVHGRTRSSAWFRLAIWLAQRGDDEDDRGPEAAEADRADSGVRPRRPRRVPGAGREPAEALAADPEPDAGRGQELDDGAGVDDQGAARAPDPRAGQLDLFGAGGPG